MVQHKVGERPSRGDHQEGAYDQIDRRKAGSEMRLKRTSSGRVWVSRPKPHAFPSALGPLPGCRHVRRSHRAVTGGVIVLLLVGGLLAFFFVGILVLWALISANVVHTGFSPGGTSLWIVYGIVGGIGLYIMLIGIVKGIASGRTQRGATVARIDPEVFRSVATSHLNRGRELLEGDKSGDLLPAISELETAISMAHAERFNDIENAANTLLSDSRIATYYDQLRQDYQAQAKTQEAALGLPDSIKRENERLESGIRAYRDQLNEEAKRRDRVYEARRRLDREEHRRKFGKYP